VFVADGLHSIQVFTRTGTYLRRWSIHNPQTGAAERVAVDARGGVYVKVIFSHPINQYTGVGVLLTSLPIRGEGIWVPGIAADVSGNVYVTDVKNNRILKFGPRR